MAQFSASHDDFYIDRVGFGRRFVATIVDNLLVSIIAVTLIFSIGAPLVDALPTGDEAELNLFSDGDATDDEAEELFRALNINPKMILALNTLNTFLFLLYSCIELITSASLGKRLMGIAIGDDNGYPATRALLARRWALKYGMYILLLIPAVATIGSIWSFLITCGCLLALGAQRQALHDMAVHSAVYYREDLSAG
jgi:uncharacterized RDD family membrane protein YckC